MCKCNACHNGYDAPLHALLYQIEHGRVHPDDVSDENIARLIIYLDFNPKDTIDA